MTLSEYILLTIVHKDEIYLNLVLEYIPETVYKVARQYSKQKQTIPVTFIKLYMYQLFRSLAYIHSNGICHRDIKPQNLLLDPDSGVLKLCDFGSAKHLGRIIVTIISIGCIIVMFQCEVNQTCPTYVPDTTGWYIYST